MGVNLVDVFEQINNVESIDEFSPVVEISEFSLMQGIEIPLTSQDTATVTAAVSTRNGRGAGSLATTFRRILPDSSWFRVCSL